MFSITSLTLFTQALVIGTPQNINKSLIFTSCLDHWSPSHTSEQTSATDSNQNLSLPDTDTAKEAQASRPKRSANRPAYLEDYV